MTISPKNPPYGRRGRSDDNNQIRNVASTFGKALFLTYSAKCPGRLAVESDAERLVAHMLTLDPRVRQFKPQPFTVDLLDQRITTDRDAISLARTRHRHRDGPKFYTPDFAVDWHGAPRSALEVKLEGFEGDNDYEYKLRLAQGILEEAGYRFARVVIPCDPKHPIRGNLPLLHQAANRVDLWPDDDAAAKIHHCMGGNVIALASLCQRMPASPSIVPVWLVSGLVASNLVCAPISGDMKLEWAYGDLGHMAMLDAFIQ